MKRIVFAIALIAMFTNLALAQNVRIITDTTNIEDIIIDEVTVKSPKEMPMVREDCLELKLELAF